MTSITTFETLDELAYEKATSGYKYSGGIDSTFWVDQLGNVQRLENQFDRQSRFRVEFVVIEGETVVPQGWRVIDLIEDGHTDPMPMISAVRYIAGACLYGA